MLETHTRTELLANPQVIAVDGNAAKFQVATDEPYKEVTTDSEGNRIVESVEFKAVGVTLQVLPNISDTGFVTLDISLEVSSLKDVRDGIPVVSKSVAESRVVVEKDHTLIIGGLISERLTDSTSGIPVLQKVPWIGRFFRNTKHERVKSELVLLLTPRIVSPSSHDTVPEGFGKDDEEGAPE